MSKKIQRFKQKLRRMYRFLLDVYIVIFLCRKIIALLISITILLFGVSVDLESLVNIVNV